MDFGTYPTGWHIEEGDLPNQVAVSTGSTVPTCTWTLSGNSKFLPYVQPKINVIWNNSYYVRAISFDWGAILGNKVVAFVEGGLCREVPCLGGTMAVVSE